MIPKLPRIEPQPTDLAWAAGILDGEGHVRIGARKQEKSRLTRGWTCQVRVANTDLRMPERMWQLFGGSVQGPRLNRLASRPSWEWVVTGSASKQALEAMLPYLVVKRDQAGIAIRFAATIHRTNQHGSRRLNPEIARERQEMVDNILAIRRREVS